MASKMKTLNLKSDQIDLLLWIVAAERTEGIYRGLNVSIMDMFIFAPYDHFTETL